MEFALIVLILKEVNIVVEQSVLLHPIVLQTLASTANAPPATKTKTATTAPTRAAPPTANAYQPPA